MSPVPAHRQRREALDRLAADVRRLRAEAREETRDEAAHELTMLLGAALSRYFDEATNDCPVHGGERVDACGECVEAAP